MASVIGKSLRMRSVSGIIAIALVGGGVGAVYANTSSPAASNGSSTATATGTKTGTTTGTKTGTGTKAPVVVKPAPAKDANGIVLTQKPGKKQVAGFKKSGKKLSATVVPTSNVAKKVTSTFTAKKGKVRNVKRAVFIGNKKVGTFTVDKYGHIHTTITKGLKKGQRAVLTFKFTSQVKVGKKFRAKSLSIKAKSSVKF